MSKKKKASELTTEGLAKRLFGTDTVQEVKRQVAEKPEKDRKKQPTKKKSR